MCCLKDGSSLGLSSLTIFVGQSLYLHLMAILYQVPTYCFANRFGISNKSSFISFQFVSDTKYSKFSSSLQPKIYLYKKLRSLIGTEHSHPSSTWRGCKKKFKKKNSQVNNYSFINFLF